MASRRRLIIRITATCPSHISIVCDYPHACFAPYLSPWGGSTSTGHVDGRRVPIPSHASELCSANFNTPNPTMIRPCPPRCPIFLKHRSRLPIGRDTKAIERRCDILDGPGGRSWRWQCKQLFSNDRRTRHFRQLIITRIVVVGPPRLAPNRAIHGTAIWLSKHTTRRWG
jgi:hypothetical protein